MSRPMAERARRETALPSIFEKEESMNSGFEFQNKIRNCILIALFPFVFAGIGLAQ